jgi:transmembrane sensor
MIGSDIRREEEAIGWVRRIADPDFADWDAHAEWLEADPRNPEVFDSISLELEEASAGLAPAAPLAEPQPVNDNQTAPVVRRRWWGAAGLAVAAGVAGLLIAPQRHHPVMGIETISTSPGVTRSLALADGTRVTLNGDSSLRIDPAQPRAAMLARGEGYFEVIHDARQPFSVRVGNGLIRDVGTAFDITLDAGAADIAVREGAVQVGPAAHATPLGAGQSARIEADGSVAAVSRADPESIGGWRNGRLSFRDTLLSRVARDLSRSLGEPVRLDPMLARRRFTGVVMLDGDHATVVRRLAVVTGLSAERADRGWRLSSATR